MIITGANVTANVAVVVIIVESAVICLVGAVEIVVAMGFAFAPIQRVWEVADLAIRVAMVVVPVTVLFVMMLGVVKTLVLRAGKMIMPTPQLVLLAVNCVAKKIL